jgi:hypothetical protein
MTDQKVLRIKTNDSRYLYTNIENHSVLKEFLKVSGLENELVDFSDGTELLPLASLPEKISSIDVPSSSVGKTIIIDAKKSTKNLLQKVDSPSKLMNLIEKMFYEGKIVDYISVSKEIFPEQIKRENFNSCLFRVRKKFFKKEIELTKIKNGIYKLTDNN